MLTFEPDFDMPEEPLAFPYVPINTDKHYVMEVAPDGCEIYMAVEDISPEYTQEMKQKLRDYLDSQIPDQPTPDEPMLA